MIIAQRETDLEVGEVGLLVELSRLKTEGVDDVVYGNHALLELLTTLLSGRVGTYSNNQSLVLVLSC